VGSELVQSTLIGVAATVLFWAGLRLSPSLWMFVLWTILFAGWFGKRLVGLVPSRYSRGFWQDALITMFILLGPMLQDSANAPDMLHKLAMRVALFIGVALYASLMVRVLEDWHTRRRAHTTVKEGIIC
jgi:TRAP-type mannitol/chloroaromatic compound transport system permease large subunit